MPQREQRGESWVVRMWPRWLSDGWLFDGVVGVVGGLEFSEGVLEETLRILAPCFIRRLEGWFWDGCEGCQFVGGLSNSKSRRRHIGYAGKPNLAILLLT